MKNLIVLMLCISFSLNAQNEYDENGHKHGPWSYESEIDSVIGIRSPRIVANFVHDTLDGLYRVYNERDILRFEGNVVMGVLEGIAYKYYDNGDVQEIQKYDNGHLSLIFWFHKNGKLYKVYELENGIPNGLDVSLSNNGRVYSSKEYKKGKEDGHEKFFKWGKVKTIFRTKDDLFIDVIDGNDVPKW